MTLWMVNIWAKEMKSKYEASVNKPCLTDLFLSRYTSHSICLVSKNFFWKSCMAMMSKSSVTEYPVRIRVTAKSWDMFRRPNVTGFASRTSKLRKLIMAGVSEQDVKSTKLHDCNGGTRGHVFFSRISSFLAPSCGVSALHHAWSERDVGSGAETNVTIENRDVWRRGAPWSESSTIEN